MRSCAALILLLGALFVTTPAFANEQKPDAIAEKMSFKLVRGVTNVFTSVAEIPKQTMITARNHGTVGYVVGPIKGFGMFLYRGLIGITETVFFMVPAPGYYEPMMDPEYVWQDWKDTKSASIQQTAQQSKTQAN
jgi:putative exosortase-associated protein (TIGR04073 family)